MGHVGLGGRAHEVPDEIELVAIALAGQDWFSNQHFAKDATKPIVSYPICHLGRLSLTQLPIRQLQGYTVVVVARAQEGGTIV